MNNKMNYILTDDQKKDLAEKVLEECYHEWGRVHPRSASNNFDLDIPGCVKCQLARCIDYKHDHNNRSFKTPQDSYDLTVKLTKNNKWVEFCRFAWEHEPSRFDNKYLAGLYDAYFIAWLITNPSRFCWLIWESKVWEE